MVSYCGRPRYATGVVGKWQLSNSMETIDQLEKRKIVKRWLHVDRVLQFVCEKGVRKWVCKSFYWVLIRVDSGPLKILKTKVWVRVGNTNNFTVLDFFSKGLSTVFLHFCCFRARNLFQKCNFSAEINVSEAKTNFSSRKIKFVALRSIRRVRGPERNQTVSARRAASKNRGQNFWNRVSKTSNRKTAPEAPKPS